ncbi:MAG: hypothetical protein J5621_02410 [Paludibacteraceae bacterium]|nr:hypothetical protein [Paludibacteraceae bacterium]
MKKFYLFFTLMMFSVVALATPSFTVSTNTIDFGTVYLDEVGGAEDSVQITVNYSDIVLYCGVFLDVEESSDEDNCTFWATPDYLYSGDDWTEPADPEVMVHYYAIAPGSYSCKIRVYTYVDDDWKTESESKYINVTIQVAANTTALEQTKTKSKSRKFFRNGELHIIRNGEIYNAQGAKE